MHNIISAADFHKKILLGSFDSRTLIPEGELVRRNSMGRGDQGSAFAVDLKLERQNQSQIKSTQIHPVAESVARELTERYQLTHMGRDADPSLVKEGGWDIIRSV